MSTFQRTVRASMAAGIVGELAYHGPLRVAPGILSGDNAENAFVGHFYTKSASTGRFTPGGEIDGTETLFGGICINPKELASFGGAEGPLSPTLFVGNQITLSFLEMGFVWLSAGEDGEAAQGMKLAYSTATGAIQLVAGDTTDGSDGGSGGATQQSERALPDGFKLVPNAVVSRVPMDKVEGGMYVAKLTN